MSITRWQDDRGISDLSIAIDEIYFLRAVLADEAAIINAHLDYKTFPKTRRTIAEAQIERMRKFAAGEMYAATRQRFNSAEALQRAGIHECLTNDMWIKQRGLIEATEEQA